jgi:hypothetical protein
MLVVPLPWFKRPTAGNLVYNVPSDTQLAVRLNRYMPKVWRGIEPDRRLPANKPPAPDNVWEDPIPARIKTKYSSPKYDHIH